MLACAALGAGVALALVANQDRVYRAQAVLGVSPVSPPADPIRVRDQMLVLVRSNETAREAANRYGVPIGIDDVRERTAVRGDGAAPVVVITADGRSPEDAAQLAKALRDAALGRAAAVPGREGKAPLLIPVSEPVADTEPLASGAAAALAAGLLLGLLAGLGAAAADLRAR